MRVIMLLVLAVLALLAIPVAVVWLIVVVLRLRDQFAGLERQVRALQAASATAPVASLAEVPAAPVADPAPIEAAAPPEPVATAAQMAEPGPWAIAAREAAAVAQAAPADGPVVMTAARASAFGDWIKANWIYAISALSLAFAGIFFVQYGMEKGLLPPAARVGMALLFGVALVGAGEWIRRRSGDGARSHTAYLPSTFSGAGIVSMFAAVLAARQLYDLIGVEGAFAGLVAVAALAVILGWFYGPFLAAVGLVGASISPFVVGGDSDSAYWLYGYFALIAATGLLVDAVRRWAWVSVLALALGFVGGWLTLQGTGGAGWFALFLTVIALLSVLVPGLRLTPDHDGPMVAEALALRGAGPWPIFPVRLAAGAIALSCLGLVGLKTQVAAESTLVFGGLALLGVVLTFWSARARALSDLAALPVLAFLARLATEGLGQGPLARDFAAAAIDLRPAELAPPQTALLLLGLGTVLTLLAAWRSAGAEYRAFWAAGGALTAPLSAVILELFWTPSAVMGAYPWALSVIALAALMAFLAVRFATADGDDRRRAAYATLSCLSLIALALFLIATEGALTLALAALIVAAALLDRRFRLPEMGWFIQAAVVGVSYRLVIDPGLGWAIERAAVWEVIAAFGGAVAAMVAALSLLRALERRNAKVFLESGAAASAALLANVLITRWLTGGDMDDWFFAHWALTLNAMPWLVLTLVQFHRMQLGGGLRWMRYAIAVVAGLLALWGIALAVGPANPVIDLATRETRLVYGPLVADTLLVAYLLPGLIVLAARARLAHLPVWIRHALLGIGCGLAALYVGLEIRRFWQGDDLSVPGITQPELYSYTVALMVLGAGLLYQAIAKGSVSMRRAAMAVIGLTVAKVFLIDAAGLTGLTRVFSFLALGLSLAGLAWLNRWAAAKAPGDGGGRG